MNFILVCHCVLSCCSSFKWNSRHWFFFEATAASISSQKDRRSPPLNKKKQQTKTVAVLDRRCVKFLNIELL